MTKSTCINAFQHTFGTMTSENYLDRIEFLLAKRTAQLALHTVLLDQILSDVQSIAERLVEKNAEIRLLRERISQSR
ncbi:MAG: hypothetical protein EAZ91_14655 [Cytophagales bacterium]|nr:MAG: hypothetical protein EAZ91_14655 [Cytophagales bacterium]